MSWLRRLEYILQTEWRRGNEYLI